HLDPRILPLRGKDTHGPHARRDQTHHAAPHQLPRLPHRTDRQAARGYRRELRRRLARARRPRRQGRAARSRSHPLPRARDAPADDSRLRRAGVSPGAGRTALVGRHGDAWKVRVTEAPERGRANEAVLRLLAETLALPRTALTLVSGHSGREKIVELTGVGPALIERRLASATQA